ncbi:MAG: hypothetical protein HYZ93_00465 [Candidatus Omnitrophica bacterium]|nr:hypothetical protein [Candidatus Omnitrophota bacterium]
MIPPAAVPPKALEQTRSGPVEERLAPPQEQPFSLEAPSPQGIADRLAEEMNAVSALGRSA